jgi:hypothetical protein
MNRARVISDFLVALARQVESLTNEELENLLDGAAVGRILRQEQKSRPKKRVEPADVQSQAAAVMGELASKSTREEAAAFLAALAPSKRVLTEAAKMREVHVVKQDTTKTISEKLIENVVGSRLDSARIRGASRLGGD